MVFNDKTQRSIPPVSYTHLDVYKRQVYISRHGCVRVEFDQDFHYCTGEVCHTPKELFDLLADDYRTYLEIELTKGKREVTEDDEREADALCKRHLERWKEEQE